MTKDQFTEMVLNYLMDFDIHEQHEILNELKEHADENWENMCDAAWEMYAAGV